MSPFEPDRLAREARRLGDSLAAATAHLGGAPAGQLGLLFGRWEDIAGPVVATHAQPTALGSGRLVVEVDDNAWAVHVRYLTADLQARIDTVVGAGTVTEIVVRVGREKRPKTG